MEKDYIVYNETDFEENIYDFFTFLKYKGEAFTGTLKYDYGLIEFKNGNANGRSIEYYNNDQIASEEIYENGEYVEGKEWYFNGQIKQDSLTGRYWQEDGKLIKENGSWLFENGNPKLKSNKKGCSYLAPNGQVAIEVTYNNTGDYYNTVKYNSEVLIEYYNEILVNHYPDLDTQFHNLVWYFWGWIGKLYLKNREKTFLILEDLSKHPNESVTIIARDKKERMKTSESTDWCQYSYHIIDY